MANKIKPNEYIYGNMYADFLQEKTKRDNKINAPDGTLANDMREEQRAAFKDNQMREFDEEREKKSDYKFIDIDGDGDLDQVFGSGNIKKNYRQENEHER